MKLNTTLLGSFALLASMAQAQQPYVPPDFYNEPYKNPIGWFANQGQLVDENGNPRNDILFSSVGCVPKACLAKNSHVYFLTYEHGATPADPVTVMQVAMRPVGANARRVNPQGLAVKDWYQNFYLPQTAPAGASQVPGYSRVVYQSIYANIDMHFYSGSGGQKMSFVMKPGANPADLQLLFTGQDSLKVDLWGNLNVYYNGQYYILPQAVAYQVGPGNSILPVNWTASYNLVNGGGVVKFNFSSYNANLPLVFQVGALPSLDPPTLDNLCWSTYLGGTNGDQVNASAIDAAGNFFVTGYSLSDFYTIPINPGTAFINGGQVIILAYFDPNYHLQWLTYYGASGSDQQGNAVALSGAGGNERIYIGGYTTEDDLYPKVETGAYNLQSVSSGYYRRAVIAKFDMSGLIKWGTYFGDGESEIHGIDVDGTGRLHIVGQHNAVNVPLHPLGGATNLPFTGITDLLLARFTTTDELNWCTVYGSGYGSDMVCTADGGFVVSGSQGTGINLPDQGGNAYHESNAGDVDCTLLKFNSSAFCTHATYFGGSDHDAPALNSLALGANGDLYLCGNTNSTSGFPLVDGGGDLDDENSGQNGFIAQFTSGLVLQWSSYVNAKLDGLAPDPSGNVFAVGTTLNNEATTAPILNAPGYYNQPGLEGNNDGVLVGYDSGHHHFYGSYFGGPEGSYPDEVTTTQWNNDRLYIGGFTTKQDNVTSFFPLHNPGLPAYYDGTYQYVPGQLGLNQNYQDAFVSSICINEDVGISESGNKPSGVLTVGPDEGGQRWLYGLPDGHFTLEVFDATGKRVGSDNETAIAGHAHLTVPAIAPGLYLVHVTGRGYQGTARFIINR